MEKREPQAWVLPPVSKAAPGPLYRQVIDGIKREIVRGRIAPGASMPSFRALAEDLLVSLITVKRAYEELEREGIVYSKQGLGTFVSDNGVARSREVKHARTAALLREAWREARETRSSKREFMQLMAEIINESEGDLRDE